MTQILLVAKGKDNLFILPKMANRHGLIAGATGTGKTVTLQVLAEILAELEFRFSCQTSKEISQG